jgi:putative nucleotidyltransferase with HDIG domain
MKPGNQSRKDRRNSKLRRVIALESAKMMYDRTETEYFTAKRKAARKMGIDFRYHPSDLPSNCEIREEILNVASLYEGEERQSKLKEMRLYALWLMRHLETFSPKLIGSTWTGHIRKGSDIDIHVFSDSLSAVSNVLDNNGFQYHVEKKRVVKHNIERQFTHIHVHGRFEVELTLYAMTYLHYCFKSSITGKAIEKASLKELELFVSQEYPTVDLATEMDRYVSETECYEMFKLLLLPLENVQGGPEHPEGDALYHSLQVCELARREGFANDIEFLQAALLHDIGKAIDPRHHAEVGAEALEGFVSPRVIFLILNHRDALDLQRGTLGHKKTIQLRHNEFFEDLMALRDFDNRGRQRGMLVDTLDEVLEYLKKLESGLETDG